MTPKKRLEKIERDRQEDTPEEHKIIIQWVKIPLPGGSNAVDDQTCIDDLQPRPEDPNAACNVLPPYKPED